MCISTKPWWFDAINNCEFRAHAHNSRLRQRIYTYRYSRLRREFSWLKCYIHFVCRYRLQILAVLHFEGVNRFRYLFSHVCWTYIVISQQVMTDDFDALYACFVNSRTKKYLMHGYWYKLRIIIIIIIRFSMIIICSENAGFHLNLRSSVWSRVWCFIQLYNTIWRENFTVRQWRLWVDRINILKQQ